MALFGTFPNIRIRKISVAVPSCKVANQDFESCVGGEGIAKFEKMTGIKARRHVAKMTTSGLAVMAGERLFEERDVPKDSIGAVIYLSQTPDYQLPATACEIQNKLGLPTDVVAFDVNLGCSGFVCGLWQAGTILASGACKRVLFLGGDTLSRCVAGDDHANKMLFGDAGFACLVEADASDGQSLPWLMGTDGSGAHVISAGRLGGSVSCNGHELADNFLHMDGLEVFNFTTSVIPSALRTFAEKSGQALDSFDAYCFHQANKFILKQMAMLTGFSARKLLYSIEDFGNTSSASIPLTLCANREKSPSKTLMAGFGVGLSWGIASYDFSSTQLLSVEEVEDVA